MQTATKEPQKQMLLAGARIFTYAKASTENEEPGDISVNSKFGFMARGGFEFFNDIFRI